MCTLFCLRETMYQMSVPKRRLSNVNCRFKVDVRSERCDPQMEVVFSLCWLILHYLLTL